MKYLKLNNNSLLPYIIVIINNDNDNNINDKFRKLQNYRFEESW